MDLNGIPLFSLMTGRMSWLSARQTVLSQNVSNADTPNYVAHDMKPIDFEGMLESSGADLKRTNVRHISVHGGSFGAPFEEEEARGEGGTPSGNIVSVEQEMIKLSDTQIQYQTAANIYQKAVNMFRTALGGRSG